MDFVINFFSLHYYLFLCVRGCFLLMFLLFFFISQNFNEIAQSQGIDTGDDHVPMIGAAGDDPDHSLMKDAGLDQHLLIR